MKKALAIAIALMFPLAALAPAQAQEVPTKAPAAKADPARKVEKKGAADEAAPAADKKAAAKAAKETAKEKVKDKVKGIPEMCPTCRAMLEYHTVARDAYKAMADSFKGDPVAKQLKGPDKKSYLAHAGAKQAYYMAMSKTHDKMVKEITKMHKGKGPVLCEAMKAFPDEVKQAMKERMEAHQAEMKKIDDAEAAMKAAKAAQQ